jgi:hypothetical protein
MSASGETLWPLARGPRPLWPVSARSRHSAYGQIRTLARALIGIREGQNRTLAGDVSVVLMCGLELVGQFDSWITR